MSSGVMLVHDLLSDLFAPDVGIRNKRAAPEHLLTSLSV
jgi:hypothetical protein